MDRIVLFLRKDHRHPDSRIFDVHLFFVKCCSCFDILDVFEFSYISLSFPYQLPSEDLPEATLIGHGSFGNNNGICPELWAFQIWR